MKADAAPDPERDAGEAGLRIEVTSLGDWAPATLVAEYDRRAQTIRVNARVLDSVRSRAGACAARALRRAAIAHELYHHVVPNGTEHDAHRFAAERYGVDPAWCEGVVRSLRHAAVSR